MAEVEIGFCAVLRHVDLTMLEWVHGAWIDVDVRVKLLLENANSARAEKTSEGGCGEALTKGGHNAASDENLLSYMVVFDAVLFYHVSPA